MLTRPIHSDQAIVYRLRVHAPGTQEAGDGPRHYCPHYDWIVRIREDPSFPWPLLTTSGRFSRDVFFLIVGASLGKPHEFVAHGNVLSASPVLAKMCSGAFIESAIRVIKLPEDTPDSVGRILEFLYGAEERALRVDQKEANNGAARKLLEVFTAADKYEVSALVERTLKEFEKLDDMTKDPMAFFRVTRDVFPDFPHAFLATFRRIGFVHLMLNRKACDFKALAEVSRRGGDWAVVFSELLANECRYLNSCWERSRADKDLVDGERDEYSRMWSEADEALERAKRTHHEHHSSCDQCPALL